MFMEHLLYWEFTPHGISSSQQILWGRHYYYPYFRDKGLEVLSNFDLPKATFWRILGPKFELSSASCVLKEIISRWTGLSGRQCGGQSCFHTRLCLRPCPGCEPSLNARQGPFGGAGPSTVGEGRRAAPGGLGLLRCAVLHAQWLI